MNKLNISTKYYLTALSVTVALPAVVIMLYEWLAGGILNGFSGSWREAVVDPDVFLIFINPVLFLSGYVLLTYLFKEYRIEDKSVLSSVFSWIVLIMATVVVFLGVFWKIFTT